MIDTSDWKPFKIGELFLIKKGKRLTKETQLTGNTPYIGAVDSNNGVTNYIEQSPIHDGNTISLSYNGSVGEAFYQEYPFWATDDVNVLYPKFNLTRNIALFICPILRLEKYRFAYGRKWTLEKMKESIIKLPTKNNKPDWQFMEEFIKEKYKKLEKKIKTKIRTKPVCLEASNWKKFKVSDLFDVKGTKTTKLDDLELAGLGIYPYVTTQAVDNGVAGYYNIFTEEGNVITADSAVIGFCSYQEKPFSASDHVEKLIPKFKMNKFNGLFIVTMLNKENYRYSYGRKFNQTKIRETYIKLPAKQKLGENGELLFEQKTENGMLIDDLTKPLYTPDWQFMENYIKSLPYSDLI